MYFYFSSAYPAAIKLNGIYFGNIGNVVKGLKLDAYSGTFVEICPLCKEEDQISFIIDKNFKELKSDNLSITDLKGGYLFKFLPSYRHGEVKVIAAAEYQDLSASIKLESGIKISVNCGGATFTDYINRRFDDAKIKRIVLNEKPLLLIELRQDNKSEITLAVYDVFPKIKRLMFITADEYSSEEGLTITERKKDIAKHVIKRKVELKDGVLTETEREVTRSKNFSENNLTEKILPYAFLEEFLSSGNVDIYLGGNVLKNARKISDYLGNFIGIMPPPPFRSQTEIGLIYEKEENEYEVNYFTFELVDRKIVNIKRSED